MSKQLSIYNYDEFGDFFSDFLAAKKLQRKSYSINALARRIGLKSPSTLVMIAKKQRLPSMQSLNLLAVELKLKPEELLYAEVLVGLKGAKSPKEKLAFENRRDKLRLDSSKNPLAVENFEAWLKWYHLLVLEMFSLKGKSSTAEQIYKRIRIAIKKECFFEAINELKTRGLLKETSEGLKTQSHSIKFQSNKSSEALQSFHKRMLEEANISIDHVAVDARFFGELTLAVRQSDWNEAQQAIFDFLKAFNSRFSAKDGDDVYHLTTAMFPLTLKAKDSM